MNMIFVEDDHLQTELISDNLKKVMPHLNITEIFTECEFRESIESFEKNPPDLFLIDIMLPWTEPSREITPPPAEVEADGFHRAGLRCSKLLSENKTLQKIPVILYTVLEKYDLQKELKELPPNTVYIVKNTELNTLIKEVRFRVKNR